MKPLHVVLGLIVLVIFLITGQLMAGYFPDKSAISPDLRLLMRSRHIYILFSALIHLILGVYWQINPQRWRRIVQYRGSAFITAGSILLIYAFLSETFYVKTFSGASMLGIVISAVGVVFHALAGILLKSKQSVNFNGGKEQ